MLDPFLPVFLTRDCETFHATAGCLTLRNTPRRSKLGAMLASGRPACRFCAPHLTGPDTVAILASLATNLTAVPA